MSRVCISVLMRSLASGKRRLASSLGPVERRDLVERMLRHVLARACEALGDPADVVLVTPCPRAASVGAGLGVSVLLEPGEAGLDAAAHLALESARRQNRRRLVLLPADLALLDTATLDDFVRETLDHAGLTAAPDRSGSGTNALGLDPKVPFAFAYGTGSLERHVAAARRMGLSVRRAHSPALAFDLDDRDDYQHWLSHAHAPAAGTTRLEEDHVP